MEWYAALRQIQPIYMSFEPVRYRVTRASGSNTTKRTVVVNDSRRGQGRAAHLRDFLGVAGELCMNRTQNRRENFS